MSDTPIQTQTSNSQLEALRGKVTTDQAEEIIQRAKNIRHKTSKIKRRCSGPIRTRPSPNDYQELQRDIVNIISMLNQLLNEYGEDAKVNVPEIEDDLKARRQQLSQRIDEIRNADQGSPRAIPILLQEHFNFVDEIIIPLLNQLVSDVQKHERQQIVSRLGSVTGLADDGDDDDDVFGSDSGDDFGGNDFGNRDDELDLDAEVP